LAVTVDIIEGDALTELRLLPDESVHCCVTSPPYFGLRDYGVAGQIGLEDTPAAFVAALVEVFREVRRVLRADGTLWLNLGDSYANDSKWGGSSGGKHVEALHGDTKIGRGKKTTGLKAKDLIGIPWRVAFALQADGWYLRQDIIWAKPNPMPESVTDRCTKAHEYLFMLSKSPRYYFDSDAIAEGLAASSVARLSQPSLDQQQGSDRVPGKTNGRMKTVARKRGVPPRHAQYASSDQSGLDVVGRGTRKKRSVWTVSTKPFKEAHFATFPPDLIVPCILAGCPKFACSACGTALDRTYEKASASTNGKAVPDLQMVWEQSDAGSQESRPQLLQQGVRVALHREAQIQIGRANV
jgi:DNA modification methylase